jgi:transposase
VLIDSSRIPHTEVIHYLSEVERFCPRDGAPLRHFGNETSESPEIYRCPSLLAKVATHKYCDALPLYRQLQMFKRFEVELIAAV